MNRIVGSLMNCFSSLSSRWSSFISIASFRASQNAMVLTLRDEGGIGR
jgi:hypothetical protein